MVTIDSLNAQMAEICEATGGEMFTDLVNRVGMIEQFVDGLGPTDYTFRWIIREGDYAQPRKDSVDEVVELLHECK